MAAEKNNIRLIHRLKAFSRWNGPVVATGGGLVLLGWILKCEPLKRVSSGFVAMNPVTALGFVMAGISLSCFWKSQARFFKAGRILAGIIGLIGGAKLTEYVFGFQLSFDQALFATQIHTDPIGVKNQIAPNTALNFLITGIVLWLLNRPPQKFSKWAQNLSLALMFISLVPLVGYLYRTSYLYGIGSYIPMALHTAALFYLLAHGLLLAQSEVGVVALFTSHTPGGAIARRLLPFTFAVPFALGALSIWGVKTETYPSELGVTIVVVGSSASFIALIWKNARLLNRAEGHRRDAEEKLKQAHDELEVRVQERTAKLNEVNQTLCLQITRLQMAQEQISEQAELLNKAQDAILVLDAVHRIVFWNKGAERLYGWESGEALNRIADELLFPKAPSRDALYECVFQTGTWTGELNQITKSGRPLTVESRWTLVRDERGAPKGILLINTDITEKKSYEAQLLRSQRMESIGALAGGIAHDLNNALTPVIIGTQLLRQCAKGDEREMLLDMVSSGARRGSEMVKQILSFARGSRGQTGPLQLRHLIDEMVKIVRETFPKTISITLNSPRNLWPVQGEVTELHQVLLNLCVNARDAMPDGGSLTIEAENEEAKDEITLPNVKVPPGSYVRLKIRDTGTGIPPEVLPRIFEPFFTTKPPEKGTGLGLSTVASIIKHHHAFLDIQTELGKGTEFSVYLPALESTEFKPFEPEQTELPRGNGDLILIIDDEEAVRELAKTTLEHYGYRAITAANGAQGISCFEEHRNEVRVLITDTDMPFLDGLSAVRAVRQLNPHLPVIIASGAKRDFTGIDSAHLLTLNKPYTVEQLLIGVADQIKGQYSKSAQTGN